jgi:hypothetical protein
MRVAHMTVARMTVVRMRVVRMRVVHIEMALRSVQSLVKTVDMSGRLEGQNWHYS